MSLLELIRERLDRTGLLVRVVALVGLGLAIVLLGYALLGAQSVRDSTNHALQERLLLAQMAARDLDERFYRIADLATAEVARLPVGGAPTEDTREAWRNLRLQLGRAVQRVISLDEKGRILWTSPFDEALLGLDLADSPLVRLAREKGEVIVDGANPLPLPAVLLATYPTPNMAILAPVAAPRGGLALVLLDLSQSEVTDLLKPVSVGGTGYTEVMGSAGNVLASSRPGRLGVTGDPRGHLGGMIAGGNPAVGTCHDCHFGQGTAVVSEDVLAIAPLPRAPLAVALRQSSGEAFALADTLVQRFLLFGGLSFFAALAITGMVVVRLVRPVHQLTAACQQMEQGDLSRPLAPLAGGEMTILATAFEAMRRRLATSQAQLKSWNQDLERQIQARTQELRQAHDDMAREHSYITTLFDSLDDHLGVVDRNYRVVAANRALLRSRGDEGQVLGQICHVGLRGQLAPCEEMRHVCPVKTVWRTGQSSRVTHVLADQAGNAATYLDVVASPIKNAQGEVVSVLEAARDVSESHHLQDQVFATSEQLSTLVSLSSAIARAMDLHAVLRLALDEVLALVGAARGAILIYGAQQGQAPRIVAVGLAPEQVLNVIPPDKRPQDRMEVRRASCGDGCLVVPIGTSERIVGGMSLYEPREYWFSDAGLQLLVSIAGQLAVAVENARLYEAVRAKEEAMGTFIRKYIEAQEEERRRIARELHDETAQTITALAMAVETALCAPAKDADEVKQRLEPGRLLAERAAGEVARIIRDLRPSLLDDLGLLEALSWYAERRLKVQGIAVNLETVGEERRLAPALETALFRVAQEAMSNILRHARAENVSLTLEFGDAYVTLDVEDDGCGFDVEATLAGGQDGSEDAPFGLIGMRERVDLLGGTLQVESRPGQGTSVTARVPVPRDKARVEDSAC